MSKKHFSNDGLLGRVREYLPTNALLRETDADGKAEGTELPQALAPNTFYVFDAEALGAFGHAIEDLALEEANGNLLAAFQTFDNFEPHRERYGHLALTLDNVEVLAAGPFQHRVRRVKFIKDGQSGCRQFWAVIFEGRGGQCLFIARQTNRAAAFEEKQFAGFYTFNPWLVTVLRANLLSLAAGQGSSLREFIRQQAIDQAAKLIKLQFLREREAVDLAIRRLQLDGQRYLPNHFAADLEKGLSRLHEWKARLPEILARADAD